MAKAIQGGVQASVDLMINSIYTHKEDLPAGDHLQRQRRLRWLCYQALTDDAVGMGRKDFKIEIRADRTPGLTVSDNGIGMDMRTWRTTWASSPPPAPTSSSRRWGTTPRTPT